MKRIACLLAILLAFSAAAEPRAASRYTVVNGVKLHYLDWGGPGDALLLLPGLGNDAHVFISFAEKFTDRFRVLALTRRGFGTSDKPAGGYDTATRVEDIRAFLDRLKIDRVHLVGHSMAGDELTLFATKYPRRVRKLVYLDAAMNRHRINAVALSDPAVLPESRRLLLEAAGSPEASKIVVRDLPPPDVWRVLVAYYREVDAFQADYRGVTAPALALYAPVSATHPMAAKETDPARRRQLNAWWTGTMIPRVRASREQFRRDMRHGRIVEIPGADHFLFRGKTEDETVRQTRAFLLR